MANYPTPPAGEACRPERLENAKTAAPIRQGTVTTELEILNALNDRLSSLVERSYTALDPIVSEPYPTESCEVDLPQPVCHIASLLRGETSQMGISLDRLEQLLHRVQL